MTIDQIIQLIQSAIQFGTVIMFGAMGEILTEKSGNLNLGVPGIMYLGGIAGLAASFFYEFNNPDPTELVCLLLSLLAAPSGRSPGRTAVQLPHHHPPGQPERHRPDADHLRRRRGQLLRRHPQHHGRRRGPDLRGHHQRRVPGHHSRTLHHRAVPGRLLFSYGFMVYLAIVVAIVTAWFLNRTRRGLNLRAVGENPATADAAGINVTRYKYLATCVGAGISGLGGLYYTMDYIKGTWANDGTIESLGWLAVALVIFATWRSVNAIWGSYLFGLLFWVYLIIPGLGRRDIDLFNMLPYLVTIAVLIFVSLRNKKENQPPASLGLSYFREER